MTITLQLSAEQERRLTESAARQDEEALRSVLLQAVESTVKDLLKPHRQPDPQARRVLLEELAEEFSDLPALPEEAISRAGIYREHP